MMTVDASLTNQGRPSPAPAVSARQTTRSLSDQYLAVSESLRRDGRRVADMRLAKSLETQLSGVTNLGQPPRALEDVFERLEGEDPIARRAVASAPPGASRIMGFLDGTQRTVSVWRCGLVPVIATVTAAAVLLREAPDVISIAPSSLKMEHHWLIPKETDDDAINDVIARVEAAGGVVTDPIAPRCRGDDVEAEAAYGLFLSNYAAMVEAAYATARDLRAQQELAVLDTWLTLDRDGEGWLVVDGRLQLAMPRAIGVVKDVSSQQLAGAEAIDLFDLPVGYRTTAFVPKERTRTINKPAGVMSEVASGRFTPVMWYLRLHDPAGQDARHGLVRLEVANDVEDADQSERIDEISSWVMAERTPRAGADERWDSLLYPMHLLERTLKRAIAADTRLWPNR